MAQIKVSVCKIGVYLIRIVNKEGIITIKFELSIILKPKYNIKEIDFRLKV